MATFGLKVAGGVGKPGLLSEVFKGAFGDPELKAKLALMSSQIWGQEHQNKLYDASTEKARQEAAKTQQELAILQAQQAAKDAAGPAYGQTLADAIHNPDMPVPVIHTPPAAQSLIGPGMPYISPDQKAAYDAGVTAAEDQRKAQRLLGPAIVQMGTSAADLAKGTGVGSGNAILLGNPTPAEARTGAILSTGNLPSKDTVVTAGDYAGTDAATREAVQTAAGKLPYDKALEQTKGEVATKQAIDIAAGTLPYDKDLEKAKAAYAAQQAVDTAKGKLPYDIELEKAKAAYAAQQAVDTAKGKLPYDIELEKAKAAAAAQQAVDTAAGKLPYDKALEQTKGDVATKQAIDIAKGKLPSDIALENAKIDEKAKVDAANNPLGTAGSGPAAVLNAKLKAKKATSSLTPEEEQLLLNTQATLDHDNAVTPGKDAPIYMPDGKGGYTRVGGADADPNALKGPYTSSGVGADSKNIIALTMLKMLRGMPLTDADSVAYRTAYESEHPDHPIVVKDANGIPSTIDPVPPPPDIPTPAEVDAAVASGIADRSGRPAFVGRTSLPADSATKIAGLDNPPPPNEFQQKNRAFSSPLLNATIELDKVTQQTLPGMFEAATINATTGAQSPSTGFFGELGKLGLRDTFLGEGDSNARVYERAVNAYVGPELYALSGMAIKPEEFARQMSANAPGYGDGPKTIARKTIDRHNFVKAIVDGGYATDPKELAKQYALAAQGGIDLRYFVLADGNKTAMMPASTAAQVAAVTGQPVAGAPAGAPAPAPVPAPEPGQPAIVAPTTPPQKAPDIRPQGYDNLSDEQWQAMFNKLPPNIQLQYRKLAGEDVSGGQ